MLSTFLSIIREIFIINIMSELFISLIGSSRYKRYVSYISGLVSIIMCVKLLFVFIGVDVGTSVSGYLEQNLSAGSAYIDEMINQGSSDVYIQSYIELNVSYIKDYAVEYGVTVSSVDIATDDGGITSITVYVKDYDDYENCMELKKVLADIYECDSSNINVYPG